MGSCASTSSVQEVKTTECRATGGHPAHDKSNPSSACDDADNSEAGVPVGAQPAGAAPVNGWQDDDDSVQCPGDARVQPAPHHEEPSSDASPLLSIPELVTEEDNNLTGKPAAPPPPPPAATAVAAAASTSLGTTTPAAVPLLQRRSSGSGGDGGGVLGRSNTLHDPALSTSLPQAAERWQHPLVTIFLGDTVPEEGEERGTIPVAIEECDSQRFFQGVKTLETLTDSTFFKGLSEGKHDTGSYKAKQQFRFWEHLHIPAHLALPLLARIKHCVDSVVFYLLHESLTAMYGSQVTCRTGVVQVLDEHGQPSTEKLNVDELASNIVAVVNASISMLERSKPLSKRRLTSSTTTSSASHGSSPPLPSVDSKKKLKEDRKPMTHAHLKKFVTNALYLLKYLTCGSALLSPTLPYLSSSNHPPVSHGDLDDMARAPRDSEEPEGAARPADACTSMTLSRGLSLPPIRGVGNPASTRTTRASADEDASQLVELLPKHFHCFSVCALLTQCMRASQFVNPAEGLKGGRGVSEELLAMYGVCKNMGLLVAKAPGVKVKVDAASAAWFATLPLYLLAPSVKADLLYLTCCETQFRLNVCVTRHKILDDVRQEVFRKSSWQGVSHRALVTAERWGGRRKQECGGFESASSAGFWKISPVFRDEGARIERGEGHGPRKELFDLLAEQTWAKYRHPLSLNKRCTATLHEGSAAVQLHWITKRCATEIPAWSKLSFGDSNDSFTSEVQSVEKTEDCLWTVRLVNAATFTMKNVGVSLAARSDPLLLKEGVCTWFSQEEEFALEVEITEEQETRLQSWGLLGWMAAQALGNGVSFNLGLPVVFYKLLLMWPKYNEEELLAGLKHTHFDLALTLEKIKALPEATFRDLLAAEGLGAMTVDEYVQQYVRDHLRNQIYPRMSAFVVGFRGSGLADLPVFASLRADELRLIIQGRSDDGLSNFYFRKEFIVTSPSEMFECEHNKIFQEILWEVLDAGFGAPTAQQQAERKREFLRFVTGRIYLPSHPQQEHLEICLPYTCFTAPEFSACTNRLPVAHTCENTLELPNYMEAVLFGRGGCYYQVSSHKEGAAILGVHKTEAWSLLSKETQVQVRNRIRELLTSKLMMAMQESNSYELDEHLTELSTSVMGTLPLSSRLALNESTTELSFTYPPEMETSADVVETFAPSPPPPLPPTQPLSSSSRRLSSSGNAAAAPVASVPCDEPRQPTPPAKAKDSPWERPKDTASLPDVAPAASPMPAAALQSALETSETPAADAGADANANTNAGLDASAQGPSLAGSKSAVTEGIGCLDWDDDSLLGTGRVGDGEVSPRLVALPRYTPTPPPQPQTQTVASTGKANGVDALLGRHLSFGAAERSPNGDGDGVLKDGVRQSVLSQFTGVNECTIIGAVPLDQTKATDPWDTEDLDDLLNNLHNL